MESPFKGSASVVKRRILVAFSENLHCIEVAVDEESPRRFKIDADENHAFITDSGKEISADEFSEKSLSRPLLTAPEPRMHGPATIPEWPG